MWARGLRYEAHIGFLKEFDVKFKNIFEHYSSGANSEPPEDYLTPVWDRLELMRLVSENSTVNMAEEALKGLQEYTYERGGWEQVEWSRDRYLGTIREELRLPPIRLMGD
ncbi:hypothetical protein SAMN04489712_12818 [Thermomonospora echinospora]|uniref:Uncharacterized protein n=1 Tax=Thermomonospora echinospora TaxID=1992 RepID=A0A1H6E0Y9_9ACTN|nr:hypothetical protein SAMN04489712_12818 [Thermomonospora echinospora]